MCEPMLILARVSSVDTGPEMSSSSSRLGSDKTMMGAKMAARFRETVIPKFGDCWKENCNIFGVLKLLVGLGITRGRTLEGGALKSFGVHAILDDFTRNAISSDFMRFHV